MSTCVKEEGGVMSRRMDVVIVLELSQWEEVKPAVLPFIDEDPKVLVQLLIDMLCLTVGLWVPCSRTCHFDS